MPPMPSASGGGDPAAIGVGRRGPRCHRLWTGDEEEVGEERPFPPRQTPEPKALCPVSRRTSITAGSTWSKPRRATRNGC